VSIFVQIYTASWGNKLQRKTLRYGRSGSFKVVETGTNRKPVRLPISLALWLLKPIFYHFRDITTYWSKISVIFRRFTNQWLVWRDGEGVPLRCRVWQLVSKKIKVPGLPDGENHIVISFDALPACDGQTDGHTATWLVELNSTRIHDYQIKQSRKCFCCMCRDSQVIHMLYFSRHSHWRNFHVAEMTLKVTQGHYSTFKCTNTIF